MPSTESNLYLLKTTPSLRFLMSASCCETKTSASRMERASSRVASSGPDWSWPTRLDANEERVGCESGDRNSWLAKGCPERRWSRGSGGGGGKAPLVLIDTESVSALRAIMSEGSLVTSYVLSRVNLGRV